VKVVDLFAGCGGLSLGFNKSIGMEVLAAYELWESAIENYKANLKHPILMSCKISNYILLTDQKN
jgi:DNA (cytosine-5)-methyltransferase 1